MSMRTEEVNLLFVKGGNSVVFSPADPPIYHRQTTYTLVIATLVVNVMEE